MNAYNPRGFLDVDRAYIPKRDVAERIQDHRDVYRRLPEPELRLQASRCMDCGVPFCNSGCPLHNLIPEWNELVSRQHWKDAIDRLHATNNFPEFTGAICPAPCENACVLTINDKAVHIKEIERTIIERAWAEGWVAPQPPMHETRRRVAIVGSGPAGLAAAQQLRRAGHAVDVYEMQDRIGGLLTFGIPDFKLEKWVVDRRVDQLRAEGVNFITGARVGESPTAQELKADHDAIVLAIGALVPRQLDVPGATLNGIYHAMDYLTQLNRSLAGEIASEPVIDVHNKRVVIIGGGDTGADCLGNAHRQGAASVTIVTHGRRPPDEPDTAEWPEVPRMLRSWPAHEEGGEREFALDVEGFARRGDAVSGVIVYDKGREESRVIPADIVFVAIGFLGPMQSMLVEQLRVGITAQSAIARRNDFSTNIEGIYVAGDATRGAALIVNAIADGRNAAASVDAYLKSERFV